MSLLVRPDDWDDPVVLPETATRFARIMVPFDGSHNAERALAQAEVLARQHDSEILVVVAYDPPITMRRRASAVLGDIRTAMADEATSIAEEAVTLLHGRGANARGIVCEGDIVDGLLDVAATEAVDVIVLGRRGITAEIRAAHPTSRLLRPLAPGSVADNIAQLATVAVLLVS